MNESIGSFWDAPKLQPQSTKKRFDLRMRCLKESHSQMWKKCANKKPTNKTQKVSPWSYHTQWVKRYCGLANKSVSQQKQAATPRIDDHQLKKQNFEVFIARIWST